MSLVLIVDDNKRISDLLSHVLAAQGYEVFSAANGHNALNILGKDCLPDLIITDYAMPRMTGTDFTHSINNNPLLSSIPVIMITGSNLENYHLPHTDNFKGLIQKPFDINTLLQLIKQLTVRNICLKNTLETASDYSA